MASPLDRYTKYESFLNRYATGGIVPSDEELELRKARQAAAASEAAKREADTRAMVAQLGGGVLELFGAHGAAGKAAAVTGKHVGLTAAGEMAAQKALWQARGMQPGIATGIFG